MADKPNKHESKYFNTARLMNEALIQLLCKKDYAYITVKDLCEKAGVNRSTFYLHYETMDDLLNETLCYTTKQFNDKFTEITAEGEEITADPLKDLMLINPKYLYPYLDFLRKNQKLYLTALSHIDVFKTEDYTNSVMKQVIFPILQKYKVEDSKQKYVLAYYISGTHAVIFEWVKGECKEDNDTIYNLLIGFIFNKSIDKK